MSSSAEPDPWILTHPQHLPLPYTDSAQDRDPLQHSLLQRYCPFPLDFCMSERDFTILPLTALVQIFSSVCTV